MNGQKRVIGCYMPVEVVRALDAYIEAQEQATLLPMRMTRSGTVAWIVEQFLVETGFLPGPEYEQTQPEEHECPIFSIS